jgi:hypothetical protein
MQQKCIYNCNNSAYTPFATMHDNPLTSNQTKKPYRNIHLTMHTNPLQQCIYTCYNYISYECVHINYQLYSGPLHLIEPKHTKVYKNGGAKNLVCMCVA